MEPTTPARSEKGPRRGHDGTVRIKDERPLQSKAYRKACAEYATKLLYPYDVPKSALASVGAITTWPALLGLLSWLVEEADETDRMKERVNSISDASRAREKALGTAWVQAGQAQTLEETAMLDKIEGLIRADYDELEGENEKCEKIIVDNDTAVENIKDSGDLDDPEEYERKNREIRGHVGEKVREVEDLRRREKEASEDRQRWEQKTGKEKEKEQKLRDQISELTQRVDAQAYSHDDLAQLLACARRLDEETCQLQEQITQCDSDTITEETQARTEQNTLQGLCHEFNECIGTGGHPAIPRANFNPEASDFLKRTFGSLAA
ncbi:kinetochore-associated Ndc80 complex subunit ndc80, partial [Perkinsus olseni]